VMDIVDVNVVGLQSFEAGFDSVHNVEARHAGVIGPSPHGVKDVSD
jgi:hypothetical protein